MPSRNGQFQQTKYKHFYVQEGWIGRRSRGEKKKKISILKIFLVAMTRPSQILVPFSTPAPTISLPHPLHYAVL